MIGELRDGVAGTGVRPGIIGEIGTDKPWVSAHEERVHRAAARAARETGMAITTHGVRSPVALAQLRIFEEEGVDPARVVIGHADSYPVLDHFLAILERGANLQFDFLGHRFQTEEAEEPRLVEHIVELLERGWGGQLLLSQDVCHNSQLKARGGFGYTYLQQHFLPTLRTAAVGEGELQQITVDNPRRILTLPDRSRRWQRARSLRRTRALVTSARGDVTNGVRRRSQRSCAPQAPLTCQASGAPIGALMHKRPGRERDG